MKKISTRRDFLKILGRGAAAAALTEISLASCSRRRLPNIILILADDLGYGELGCYGQEIIQTPYLDRMAHEGMRFTQFYSGSPVCAPSRCVLLTGKHTGRAFHRDNGRPQDRPHDPEKGIFAGQYPLPSEEITLPELLKARGYATAAVGKWGLGAVGTEGDPNRQGFDLFYGYNCQVHAHNHYPRFLWRNNRQEQLAGNTRGATGKHYSQDLFILEAVSFIRRNKHRPFFLYLPFIIPHLAIQVPDDSLDRYRSRIPEAPYDHRSGYQKHPFPRAAYAAMITRMDYGIGKILDLLKKLDLDRNTLILFTSDNGPAYRRLGGSDSEFFHSAGPFRGLKGDLYEGGIRVPLIARWSGKIPPGKVSSHVSAFWDLLPTLAELAGAEAPSDICGLSMVPTLFGRSDQSQPEFLYWEFPGYGGQQAVRWGKWKAIRINLKRPDRDRSWQLYDLDNDPGERENLAEKHPEVLQRIKEIVPAVRSESRQFPFPEAVGLD